MVVLTHDEFGYPKTHQSPVVGEQRIEITNVELNPKYPDHIFEDRRIPIGAVVYKLKDNKIIEKYKNGMNKTKPIAKRRSVSSWTIGSWIAAAIVGLIVALAALLIPAVQRSREAASRTMCSNNYKQVGIALIRFHDTNGALPAASISSPGPAGASWRVAILPYLEQNNLYEQFAINEPVSSQTNLRAASIMPKVYECPSGSLAAPGTTYHQALVGRNSALAASKGTRFATFLKGVSGTILTSESKTSAAWASSGDLSFGSDAASLLPNLGGYPHAYGFHALFGDGSVRFLQSTISADEFRGMASKTGSETSSR